MRNSANKHLEKEIFKKGYFEAQITDLSGFVYGKEICLCCNEEKTKFIYSPIKGYEKICLDCLQKNDLELIHDSEHGIVTLEVQDLPEELKYVFDINNFVSKGSIRGLMNTPDFVNIQGERWLIHCQDFMVFKGLWDTKDFTENSKEKNGKKLFIEMTEEEYNYLWDEYEFAENETTYSWEDVFYYAFE